MAVRLVLAFARANGELLWATAADSHPAAVITQSPTIFDGRVYVGVSSVEEALAAFVPGYPCCSFQGSILSLNPDTGAVAWVTQAGPGGIAGGLQWGTAVDGKRVYTANANSEFKAPFPNGGVWSALDAATGEILWQTTPTYGGSTSGPVTTANGVVYGCSLDADGWMYALNAATGQILWEFESGGSCLSGAAISNGMVFWGSGYVNLGITGNDKLYAFALP